MSEDSLLERVTAATEERHLSENTLTAYWRTWLKLIARRGGRVCTGDLARGQSRGVLRGGDAAAPRRDA